MSLPDILFKGVPRRYTRGYTAKVIREREPKRVIVPCAGSFGLVSTVVQAGIKPEDIYCCDISLYTSVLGSVYTGQRLGVRAIGDFEWLNEFMVDEVGDAAAVVLAIRILQYKAKRSSVYTNHRIRELHVNAAGYIEQARARVEESAQLLMGVNYAPEDMWDLLERYIDDKDALICCNPPRYSGGYSKMYEGVDEAFEWPEPIVRQFDEKDYPALFNLLGRSPALSLVYYATPVSTSEDPCDELGPPWKSVFADRPRTGRTAAINWIMSNQANLDLNLKRADTGRETPKPKYPLFTEHEIKPDSDLRVLRESRDLVSYYRDLLVHKLPMINSENHCVLLLDGRLLAAVGLHMQNYLTSNLAPSLTFAFSPHHKIYTRMQKLVLMSVCSIWFWEGISNDPLRDPPVQVQTTMLTQYPEVKTARGIFDLKDREQQEDGSYKLTYYGDVINRTAAETVREWLDRYGKLRRT